VYYIGHSIINKFVSVVITLTIAIAIIFAIGLPYASGAYAQIATTTTPPVAGINATTIVNAINTKVKLVYGDEDLHNAATGKK
jgi:hypothetical protein